MVYYNIWEFNRIAILAFHKALSDQPRSPLVVAAFSLAVHNGGDILEAAKITKKITRPHDSSFFELVQDPEKKENIEFQTLLDEVMDLDASVKDALNQMTDGYYISKAMAAYPQAPFSDMVIEALERKIFRTKVVKLMSCDVLMLFFFRCLFRCSCTLEQGESSSV